MTGTDLCVNKCKQSRSYLNHLVFQKTSRVVMVYFCTMNVLAYGHVRTRTVSFTLPVDTTLFHRCSSR